MAEEIILQDGNVSVTTARVVIAGKTYALRNITSVRMANDSPNNGCAVLLMAAGGVFLALALVGFSEAGDTAVQRLVVGLVAIVVGVVILMRNRPVSSVMIATAAGEQGALTSRDFAYVSKVVEAINEAVVRYR